VADITTAPSAGTAASSEREAIDRASASVAGVRAQLEGLAFRRTNEHETASRYLVEIHKKYAIPFACVVFVLVGCPLGVITRGGNFGISAMISLGFYIVYWVSLIGGEKLADRNILSPAVAMWSGNILFVIIAVLLAYKVNYETTPMKWLFSRLRHRHRSA
jgi:lipopolysaccharide export system permease protein